MLRRSHYTLTTWRGAASGVFAGTNALTGRRRRVSIFVNRSASVTNNRPVPWRPERHRQAFRTPRSSLQVLALPRTPTPSATSASASPEMAPQSVCESPAHPVGGRTRKTASAWPPGGRRRSRPSPGGPGRPGSGSPADQGGSADVSLQECSSVTALKPSEI